MTRWLLALSGAVFLAAPALAADGLITVESAHPVARTIDRLASAAGERGLTVVARIDHAAAAQKAGLELTPVELLIFGNPKAGTPLMRCAPSIGIDLPLKALAWQDADGKVWLAANDMATLRERHGLGAECDEAVARTDAALRGLLAAAAGP